MTQTRRRTYIEIIILLRTLQKRIQKLLSQFYNILIFDDLKIYASEFLGTAILMAAGISALCVNFGEHAYLASLIPNVTARLALSGAGFGIGIVLVAYSVLGQTSGGHLNPALTIAFWMQKKIEINKLFPYIASQCLGSITGTWLVAITIPNLSSSVGYGVTSVAFEITPGIAVLLEGLLTMLFVLVIFWMTSSHDRSPYTGLAAFIYLVIFVPLEAPLTGASFNPARSIGPAIYANNYANLFVYIIAPITGAVAGTLISRHVLNHQPKCKRICRLQSAKADY